MLTPVHCGTPVSGPTNRLRGYDQAREVALHAQTPGRGGGSGGRGQESGGRGQESGGRRQGSGCRRQSYAQETAGHGGSVEKSVHRRSKEVPVVDHKEKFWLLDWVGDVGEAGSGLLLYTIIQEQIRPIGGIVSWSGKRNPFATFEMTMVLNDKDEKVASVKHVAVRWTNHKGYDKSLVDLFNPDPRQELRLPDLPMVFDFFDSNKVPGQEAVTQKDDITTEPKSVMSAAALGQSSAAHERPSVGALPLRTSVSTPVVPKWGHIASEGLLLGPVAPQTPKEIRPVGGKEPLSYLRGMMHSSTTSGADVQRHQKPTYFEDRGEESSGESTEREEDEEGSQGRSRESRGEEEEDSENTISEKKTQLEHDRGELHVRHGDNNDYEKSDDRVEHDDEPLEEEPQQKKSGKGRPARTRTPSSAPAAVRDVDERKRKARHERTKSLEQKRSRKESVQKRQVQPLPMEEAVQRARDADAAAKQKPMRKKRAAKGGTMEKTTVFPASEQPQYGDERKGKTVARPSSLQLSPSEPETLHLDKGFFLDYNSDGTRKNDIQFISIEFDKILDIPDKEFRYNQRFLGQNHIDEIYEAMVSSGETTIRERTTGRTGLSTCPLYEKPILLLVALHNKLRVDSSGKIMRVRRVTPEEFYDKQLESCFWYPLSDQHNVAAARRCFRKNAAVANELQLNYWTVRPVYYPDHFMDHYGTLSTFQNAKDKWNTPPHQSIVVQDIRKLWKAFGCPDAKGGQGTDVKNVEYRKFAGKALRVTDIDYYLRSTPFVFSDERERIWQRSLLDPRELPGKFCPGVTQVHTTWSLGQAMSSSNGSSGSFAMSPDSRHRKRQWGCTHGAATARTADVAPPHVPVADEAGPDVTVVDVVAAPGVGRGIDSCRGSV
ncbi:hypothetical protein CBR_g4321 [Chara braunii]|uniref:Uncharacterized protein n=1 Tax=Chara braunii TaxID=69332 RepID=A0A388JRG0_CHABU|nr:hypothetical protein CBR_g4321 [Chara braunii]|eukprot:GBG60363.1 hypothetical protein CBR_g4321 [Chara braunii]